MTSEQLAAIAGIALSLVFSYIPGVKDFFDTLPRNKKQTLMGIALLLVAGAVFALSCAGVSNAVSCDKPGALGLLNTLIIALIANQSVYAITKK